MTNPFFENGKSAIPRNLDDCCFDDNTARKLWDMSIVVESWGAIILLFIIIIGLISSVITSNFIGEIADNASIATFLISIIPWAIGAFFEYASYHLISLALRAIAAIVQNTKVSAMISLYNAAMNANQSNNPNQPDKTHPHIVKRVSVEEYHKDSDSEAVPPAHSDSGEIICPKCGKKQPADRTICWYCNQKFS